jgi:hypothetical protein
MATVCGGMGGAGIGGAMAVGAIGQAAWIGIGGIMPIGTTTMTVPIAGFFVTLPPALRQQAQAAQVAWALFFPLQQSLHLQSPSHLQPSLQHLQPPSHLQPSLHLQDNESQVSVVHFPSLQQPWHAPLACSQHSSAKP